MNGVYYSKSACGNEWEELDKWYSRLKFLEGNNSLLDLVRLERAGITFGDSFLERYGESSGQIRNLSAVLQVYVGALRKIVMEKENHSQCAKK